MGHYFVNLTCSGIDEYCHIQDTIYGYYPSLGFNSFFVAAFSVLTILHATLAIRYRTYFIGWVLTVGSAAEAIGYGGRVLLHQNPFDSTAFSIQISCLVFAPSFIAAAVYITLKDIVGVFGSEVSWLKPAAYAWGFISCDVFCLILQSVGGGLAGSAGTKKMQRDVGTDLMISGIVIQVFTMLAFAALVIDYALRKRKQWAAVPHSTRRLAQQPRFRTFLVGVAIAYLAVLTRCVYRIPELMDGWGNPLMRDEGTFIALDGFMVFTATLVFVIFHPGVCFNRAGFGLDSKYALGSAEAKASDR